LREYEDALKYKKHFEDGVELTSSLLKQIVTYYEQNRLEIPDREKVFRFMGKLIEIVSPEAGHPRKYPEDGTKPEFGLCNLSFVQTR
jgi:hypothetical protein